MGARAPAPASLNLYGWVTLGKERCNVINGAHVIVYSQDPGADRAFIQDILAYPSVDAGDGWLIFKSPPAEIAVHPTDDGPAGHELFLMCDDLETTMNDLTARGVQFARPVSDERWGRLTAIRLPGGGEIGLYEPRHPTAYNL
jgi:hypothetical protein